MSADDHGAASGFMVSLAAGSRIAGYRLEERIGQGGMSVVFRARDERLDRPVALKVLASALAGDEEFRRRFIRESRAAASIDDPHIVPVLAAGEADGMLFIAMRYVAGGDARSLLNREGPLPPGRVAAITSPGGLGAGCRASGRPGASGREAVEHAHGCAARTARSRLPVRLRPEQSGGVHVRGDRDRSGHGDAGLHGTGADRGQAGRRPPHSTPGVPPAKRPRTAGRPGRAGG